MLLIVLKLLMAMMLLEVDSVVGKVDVVVVIVLVNVVVTMFMVVVVVALLKSQTNTVLYIVVDLARLES